MNKELARTLTTALVQFIDKERPEGTMCCSNGICVALEKAFINNDFDRVEELVKYKLSGLTGFEEEVSDIVEYCKEHGDAVAFDYAKRHAKTLLAIAKKELCKGCDANIRGYIKGQEDAEKRYNESVAYHFPEAVPPGVVYKSPQYYTDVLTTPNIQSGTSTAKMEG